MKKIYRFLYRALFVFLLSTVLAVVVYRFVPVYYTPLMFIRCFEQVKKDKPIKISHKWVKLEKISPNLVRAVIAAEDTRFFQHSGFDFEAIQKAREENKKRRRPRGASTISQQTAKNVFLWPESSWLRKGLEAYFTVLIEAFWSKERILEVYLNSIEMGDGVYGAAAVAEEHFLTTPNRLTVRQSALIAATLPNPLQYSSKKPSSYVVRRQTTILERMKQVELESDKK